MGCPNDIKSLVKSVACKKTIPPAEEEVSNFIIIYATFQQPVDFCVYKYVTHNQSHFVLKHFRFTFFHDLTFPFSMHAIRFLIMTSVPSALTAILSDLVE